VSAYTRGMRLAITIIILLLAREAGARGINFEIFGGDRVIAETARVLRCPPEVIDARGGRDKVATCRPVGTGWLVGVTRGTGVDVALVRKDGTVAWRRAIDGTVAFADGLLLVQPVGTAYRAVWLSEADGGTVRQTTFSPVPAEKLPHWCGDRIEGTYRSSEPTPRLAAVCFILD
jgi:hypothetical protein